MERKERRDTRTFFIDVHTGRPYRLGSAFSLQARRLYQDCGPPPPEIVEAERRYQNEVTEHGTI